MNPVTAANAAGEMVVLATKATCKLAPRHIPYLPEEVLDSRKSLFVTLGALLISKSHPCSHGKFWRVKCMKITQRKVSKGDPGNSYR